jgi:putative DNA primase/helicase
VADAFSGEAADDRCPNSPSLSDSGTLPEDWAEPQPLPDGLPDVEPFVGELLPDAWRPWVEDVADRMQCPREYVAVPAIVALSAVVGRQVAIRPKVADDWTVVPNLWGGVVGRPGQLKTPAIEEALRPLRPLETRAREEYDEAVREHEAVNLVSEARQKKTKTDVAAALRRGQDAEAIALAYVREGAGDTPPARRRYRTSDPTVEKLGELLRDNPRGILVYRDELTGFLRGMDREGHEADRAFYLEAWNGTSSFTYDRIGRGTIEIDAACVSVLGSIQPGPLSAYMARAAHGGAADDGLVQRLQVVVWPDPLSTWRDVDRLPNAEARRRVTDTFDRLDRLDPTKLRAQLPEGGGLPYLQFAQDAQEVFTDWRTSLEHRLHGNDLPPVMEAHLAKFRSLVPSLALLIHLADAYEGPVTYDAVLRACAWGEYLESHAWRVYAPVLSPGTVAVRNLGEHIRSSDLGVEFAAHKVQQKGWSGLTDHESVGEALSLLVDLDWLRVEVTPTRSRPRKRYLVSPRICSEGRN